VGVILADLFLSRSPADAELTEKMGEIASTSFSPFLCGIGAEYFAAGHWDEVADRFDPALFRETSPLARFRSPRSDSPHVVLMLPRWRIGARTGSGSHRGSRDSDWLHPGYLISAKIARAMNTWDLEEITTNLFPSWRGSSAAAAESQAGMAGDEWDPALELECGFNEKIYANLAELGFNAISLSGLQRADWRTLLTTGGARPDDNLARTLLGGHVAQSIYQYAR
jgi:hypothetical protein